jgi:hypothetical protein
MRPAPLFASFIEAASRFVSDEHRPEDAAVGAMD